MNNDILRRRVIVTGGGGFLGSHLCERLFGTRQRGLERDCAVQHSQLGGCRIAASF